MSCVCYALSGLQGLPLLLADFCVAAAAAATCLPGERCNCSDQLQTQCVCYLMSFFFARLSHLGITWCMRVIDSTLFARAAGPSVPQVWYWEHPNAEVQPREGWSACLKALCMKLQRCHLCRLLTGCNAGTTCRRVWMLLANCASTSGNFTPPTEYVPACEFLVGWLREQLSSLSQRARAVDADLKFCLGNERSLLLRFLFPFLGVSHWPCSKNLWPATFRMCRPMSMLQACHSLTVRGQIALAPKVPANCPLKPAKAFVKHHQSR